MDQIFEEYSCVVSEPYQGDYRQGDRLAFSILREIRCLTGRRRVWHALSAEQEVLIKCFLPHRKQRRDVRREWMSALFLHRHGVRGPTPLFKAVAEDGAVLVIYEFLSNAREVAELVREEHTEVVTESLKQLTEVHEKMHEIGAYQADDHLANYLWLNDEIYVIDVGSVVLGKAPLPRSKRVNNLAKLLSYTPAYWHSFLFNELSSKNSFFEPVGDRNTSIERLIKKTDQEIHSRLAQYIRKTRRTSEEFIHKREDYQKWHAHRRLDETLRIKFTDDAKTFRDFTDNDQFVLRRFARKSCWSMLLRGQRFPDALSEWSKAQALHNFDVPVALPMLCVLNRTDSTYDYLLIEQLNGQPLHHVLVDEFFPGYLRVVQQLAKILITIESMGGNYDALSSQDFILDPTGLLKLVGLRKLSFEKHRRTTNPVEFVKSKILSDQMNDEWRECIVSVLGFELGKSLCVSAKNTL